MTRPGVRSSISLYLAVLVLVLSTVLGSFVDLKNNQMHARHAAISTGLERMLRLNRELNSIVLLSVAEQSAKRASSYDAANTALSNTIEAVEALAHQQDLAVEMTDLRTEHAKLHAIEAQALQLMRQERWQEAHRMLLDPAYVLSKQTYERNSEAAVAALTEELATMADRVSLLRTLSLAARIAALMLLLWVGAMFSRRLRADLAEQARLREAVSAANLALEEKVLQRTSELEAANRKLQELSSTDGLTGIANRRRFDAVWEAEWQRALRQGLTLAVAMIDVDHFKAYNDHYGHPAGDECLKRLAQVLSTTAQRAGELAARYGGEEFVVILPGVGREDAFAEAERIRNAVQALGVAHAYSTNAGVLTVSIGVAVCIPSQGDSPMKLVRAADAALYEAKRLGRNQVRLAE